jgi:hypothetical protein
MSEIRRLLKGVSVASVLLGGPEQPLSPTNKRLTIPVVRAPLLADRAIRTTTRLMARRIRPWAVGRRCSNSWLLCAASARSSRKV